MKHGFVVPPEATRIQIPSFPKEIPCNVCVKEIALRNIYRKHSGTGSWQPLERDIFLHKFMGEEKSTFLILEQDTGIISANPHPNQGFVRNEIFKEESLKTLGFTVQDRRLNSVHSDEEASSILTDISQEIKEKQITTRKNRGKVRDVLSPYSQRLIDKNKSNESHPYKTEFAKPEDENRKQRQSKRTNKKENVLFGGRLYLRVGEVSNFYRDIVDLHQFYIDNKNTLSQSFPGLIRMSLRLLCETAAKEQKKDFDRYLKENFDEAKGELSKDLKTTLSNQNVSRDSIVQLLHTGAHIYQSSTNMEQTVAISVIIGSILTITHGRENLS